MHLGEDRMSMQSALPALQQENHQHFELKVVPVLSIALGRCLLKLGLGCVPFFLLAVTDVQWIR